MNYDNAIITPTSAWATSRHYILHHAYLIISQFKDAVLKWLTAILQKLRFRNPMFLRRQVSINIRLKLWRISY